MENKKKDSQHKHLVIMPNSLHRQIVGKQYDIFKKENKHVSVNSLINNALSQVYSNQKELVSQH